MNMGPQDPQGNQDPDLTLRGQNWDAAEPNFKRPAFGLQKSTCAPNKTRFVDANATKTRYNKCLGVGVSELHYLVAFFCPKIWNFTCRKAFQHKGHNCFVQQIGYPSLSNQDLFGKYQAINQKKQRPKIPLTMMFEAARTIKKVLKRKWANENHAHVPWSNSTRCKNFRIICIAPHVNSKGPREGKWHEELVR